MQEAIGIRKLRDELIRHIGRVRREKRIVITDRGKPVAVLMPYMQDKHSSRQDRLEALLGWWACGACGKAIPGQSAPGQRSGTAGV